MKTAIDSESSLLRQHRYFQTPDKKVTIYNGDALQLLHEIPDQSIDMIFADPPYFGNQSGNRINRTDGRAAFSTDKAAWARSQSLQYQFEFHYRWIMQSQRILRRGATIWITGTYHSIGVVNVVLQDLGYKILNDIVLHKRNAPPNFKGSCFRAVTETMLWAKRDKNGKTKFNYWDMKEINGGKQMSNLWEFTAKKNPFRHPATKQPIVLEHCIQAASNGGDTILDPFAGSGTTGYVGRDLGRKVILMEIEKESCNLTKERLEGKYDAQ